MHYGDDLAYIHDTGHGRLARDAARFVLRQLKHAGYRRGLVVDLGCGSGILAAALARGGFEVLGIDQSASMLKIARTRAPGAKFVRASLYRAKLPRCCAVVSTGECFNYLFERSAPRRLAALFKRVHSTLEPGGLFIFDIATPGRGGGSGIRQKNISGPDWAILLQTEERVRPPTLIRRIVAFRRAGRCYRRSDERHELRLLRPAEVLSMLRKCGFTARGHAGYGSGTLARGWVVVSACKAAANASASRSDPGPRSRA